MEYQQLIPKLLSKNVNNIVVLIYWCGSINSKIFDRRRKEMMEVSGESWRAYYTGGAEHPLSAATSAVLGVADDPQPQPLVTEYYKLPPLAQETHLNLHKDVWP